MSQLRPSINLLRSHGLDIVAQLRLEEALLRATQQNWVLINDGAFRPAVVMGISGCVRTRVGSVAAMLSLYWHSGACVYTQTCTYV